MSTRNPNTEIINRARRNGITPAEQGRRDLAAFNAAVDELREGDDMSWTREAETARPCRRCQEPTTRVEGYTDEGDCESGPFVVERPLCAPCAATERAEAEAMAEAYEAWERSHFATDAEYQQYVQDMERQYAEMGDDA